MNDSLYIKQVFSPCEDFYYYYQPEYCLEELADEFGMGELEDLQEMKIENQLIFKSEEYYMDAVSPNVNFPEKFNLYSNFPNPFNPITTIRFDVGSGSNEQTILNVYDISGRKIKILLTKDC